MGMELDKPRKMPLTGCIPGKHSNKTAGNDDRRHGKPRELTEYSTMASGRQANAQQLTAYKRPLCHLLAIQTKHRKVPRRLCIWHEAEIRLCAPVGYRAKTKKNTQQKVRYKQGNPSSAQYADNGIGLVQQGWTEVICCRYVCPARRRQHYHPYNGNQCSLHDLLSKALLRIFASTGIISSIN